MTPQEFIAKWRAAELKERSASQSHFNDLSALLGVLDPIAAGPVNEWFANEKAASKTSGDEAPCSSFDLSLCRSLQSVNSCEARS